MSGTEHLDDFEYLMNHSEWAPREVEGYQHFSPEELEIDAKPGVWLPEDPGSIVLRSPSDSPPHHFTDMAGFDRQFRERRMDNQYAVSDVLDIVTKRLEFVAGQNPGEPLALKPTIYFNDHLSDARVVGLTSRIKLYWQRYEEEMARVMMAQMMRAFEIEERLEAGEERTEMPVAASISEADGTPTFSGIHVSRDVELGNFGKHAEDITSDDQLRIDKGLEMQRYDHHGRVLTVGQTCCQMCTMKMINGKFDVVIFGSENDELGVEQHYNKKGRGKLTMTILMGMKEREGYGSQSFPVIINMGQIGMHAAAHAAIGIRDDVTQEILLNDPIDATHRPIRITDPR